MIIIQMDERTRKLMTMHKAQTIRVKVHREVMSTKG